MSFEISPLEVIGLILVMAWLGACVVHDLKSRQVPILLTVIPLTLAGIVRFYLGSWRLPLLIVALILISDLPKASWRIPAACLVTVVVISVVPTPDLVYQALVIFAVWALWEIGATGGADAKIIITLILFFSDGLLFIPIVMVGGVQGLVALFRKRETIPYTVSIAGGTALWLFLVR
jgi:hypothetical protein